MKYVLKKNITIDMFDDKAFIMKEVDGVVDITKTLLVENVGFDVIKILMDEREVSLNDICDKISEIYDCNDNSIENDILSFLDQLSLAGVIETNG